MRACVRVFVGAGGRVRVRARETERPVSLIRKVQGSN